MTSSSPQDRTPNTQKAFFVALAFGAMAIIIYMFCVQPAQTSLARARQNLETLQMQQGGTERDLKGAGQLKERLAQLEAARQPWQDGLLTPLLASYAMRAKSILDPVAAESGLVVTDYAELPKRLLPLPKPTAPQLYARQPVRLSCRGSYAAIISFMMRVEKTLPLVSVQSFSLKAQQQNHDTQLATLVLEWPVLGVNTAAQQPANGGARK